MIQYYGYLGKVEFDDEAELFYGEIINIRDVITFQGNRVAELTKAFRDSIDDNLEFCEQRGEAPGKPFSGHFVTRIPPDLHRQVHLAAVLVGKALNAFVTEQLQVAVQTIGVVQAAGKKVASTATKAKAAKALPRKKKELEQ